MKMKKIIAISIVTSAVLFGAGATNLSTDQVNLGTGSDISNATVNQGTMDITDGTGTTTVDNYAHGGHTVGEGANTNTIDGTTVNGASTSNSSIVIDQGRLEATNGATVTNSNDHSENTIDGGTIDVSSGDNTVTVKQGDIEIDGATYDNMEVHSTNDIKDVDIDASGDSSTVVTQATLVVDSNLTGGTGADYTLINTTNKITNGSILNSTVKQAHTEIRSGATVYGLDIDQRNTIGTLNSDNSDINGSTVLQGVTKIDGTGTTVTDLKIDAINNINGVDATSSEVVQNHINIHSGSTANGMTVNSTDNYNTISDVDAENSGLYQGTINMTGSSTANSLTVTDNNLMEHVDVTDNSKLYQGSIDMNNSTVTNLSIAYDNTISNIDDGTNLHIGQAVLDLNNATLASGVAIGSINRVDHVNSTGANNEIHQAITVVDSSTLNASTSILSNNNIELVNLDNTDISQNSISLVNNGTMGVIDLDNTNIVSGADTVGSDMNNSSITQAELIITNSTLGTLGLTQDTRNELEHVTLITSEVRQARVAIGNSDVNDIALGSNAQDITNDIDSPSIDYSTVSQNGLKICNADVNGLSVAEDNDLTGGDIVNSIITQGDINIEGTGEACLFAQAEHAHPWDK